MVLTSRPVEARDEGAVAVLVALLSLVLLTLSAIVVDLGYKSQVRREAQGAVDTAALAAADFVYGSGTTPDFATAVAKVKDYALLNFKVPVSAWAGCTDNSLRAGWYTPDSGIANTCISFDSQASPTVVHVTLPARDVPSFFAGLPGSTTSHIAAGAEAKISRVVGPAPCGLCLLNPHAPDTLNLHGNGPLDVTGNGIVVDSDSPGAAQAQGNGGATSDTDICIHGKIKQGAGQFKANKGKVVQDCQNVVTDPLAAIQPPTWSGLGPSVSAGILGPGTPSCTNSPAAGVCVYKNINATGPASITLAPGTYVITGGLTSSSNASVLGPFGVTLYFAPGAGVSFAGNGSLVVHAPRPKVATDCPAGWGYCEKYRGLAIFFDRSNTGVFQFKANGTLDTTGALYAKSALLDLQANGGVVTLRSLVVADRFNAGGNGGLTIAYSQDDNPPTTPTPAGLCDVGAGSCA
jgi:hypothetical protein